MLRHVVALVILGLSCLVLWWLRSSLPNGTGDGLMLPENRAEAAASEQRNDTAALPNPLALSGRIDQSGAAASHADQPVKRHRSVAELERASELAATPAAAAEALQWSLYCMSVWTSGQLAENSASPFPMPLRFPDKVVRAEERLYRRGKEAEASGTRIDPERLRTEHEASLTEDERARAVQLPPAQAKSRQALIEASRAECGSGSSAWRTQLLATTRAGGSALGELLRARQQNFQTDCPGERATAEATYSAAVERAIRERDAPALAVLASTAMRVDVDWAGRGADVYPLSPLYFFGGRAALQLALCDIAIDCETDGFASRAACIDYGACDGDSLAERWRNALRRDGLPANLFDEVASDLRGAVERGDVSQFGLNRRH